MNNKIFITGGTGYIGSRAIPIFINNNFEITALARKGSESKLPDNCKAFTGNALDSNSYEKAVEGNDTFIHLIGVHHPGPGKKDMFKKIDLVSIKQAVDAASKSGVKHFIYLSVAHPAPVMKEFIEVRMEGEDLIKAAGIPASFIRPWYVLGPGHYWPYALIPFYKIAELIPPLRDTALRLGLVKLNQISNCILYAAKNPPDSVRIYDVKEIKKY